MKRIVLLIKSVGKDQPAEEDYEIPDDKNPAEYGEEVCAYWNSTLREGESRREFVGVKESAPIAPDDKKYFVKCCRKFVEQCRREHNNAYGSAWCKQNFLVVNNAYHKMMSNGKTEQIRRLAERSGLAADFPEIAFLKTSTVANIEIQP